MNSLVSLKTQEGNLDVIYEIKPYEFVSDSNIRESTLFAQKIRNIDFTLIQKNISLDEVESQIEKYTSNADSIDYILAVSSGILSGLIDILFVGDFSLDRGTQWGKDRVDNFVLSVAKMKGYEGDKLDGAVRFLEKKYPIPADSATNIFGGGATHHLKDFSHHPTPLGLMFSLLTQFTGKVYGTNSVGAFIVEDVPSTELIGDNIFSKISIGFINWLFHMVSDMAGSSSSITYGKYGTGLPGPFVSLLKELSSLPIFSHEENCRGFAYWVSKLFNGTLLAKRDENNRIIPDSVIKFDLRAEIGVSYELGRQAVPVIINECLVRLCYFVRRLIREIKLIDPSSINDIINNTNWDRTLPFKNRTITRMITISSATFFVIDVADAGIRAAIKSGGDPVAFAGGLLLRLNFVESGRFLFAITDEICSEINEYKTRNRQITLLNDIISLHEAKYFYLCAGEWSMLRDAAVAVNELENYAFYQISNAYKTINEIHLASDTIAENIISETSNQEEIQEIMNILKY